MVVLTCFHHQIFPGFPSNRGAFDFFSRGLDLEWSGWVKVNALWLSVVLAGRDGVPGSPSPLVLGLG